MKVTKNLLKQQKIYIEIQDRFRTYPGVVSVPVVLSWPGVHRQARTWPLSARCVDAHWIQSLSVWAAFQIIRGESYCFLGTNCPTAGDIIKHDIEINFGVGKWGRALVDRSGGLVLGRLARLGGSVAPVAPGRVASKLSHFRPRLLRSGSGRRREPVVPIACVGAPDFVPQVADFVQQMAAAR